MERTQPEPSALDTRTALEIEIRRSERHIRQLEAGMTTEAIARANRAFDAKVERARVAKQSSMNQPSQYLSSPPAARAHAI